MQAAVWSILAKVNSLTNRSILPTNHAPPIRGLGEKIHIYDYTTCSIYQDNYSLPLSPWRPYIINQNDRMIRRLPTIPLDVWNTWSDALKKTVAETPKVYMATPFNIDPTLLSSSQRRPPHNPSQDGPHHCHLRMHLQVGQDAVNTVVFMHDIITIVLSSHCMKSLK